MGFDEAEIFGTSLRDPETSGERLRQAKSRIGEIVGKWYK